MNNKAVISMDVEDWFHSHCFPEANVDRKYSLLDGLDIILSIMDKYNIRGSFFVVGELLESLSSKLVLMDKNGHDIGCHNWFHLRPISMEIDVFKDQLKQSKRILESILGHDVNGYRAPCFGLDNVRLEVVRELGFKYDSSMLRPQKSSKYGTLSLKSFQEIAPCIYRNNDFYEFEVSTQKFLDMNILLGGGYFRMLPWAFIKWLTFKYLESGHLYVMYIHPLDLSPQPFPHVKDITINQYLRTHIGRGAVISKFEQVIQMLKNANYSFTTFEQLRQEFNSSQKGI